MKKLAYGRRTAESYIRENIVREVYLQHGFSDQRILHLLASKNIKVNYISKDELNSLTNSNSHQGIAFISDAFEYYDVDLLIEESKKLAKPLLLILDSIVDPHNLGAIIRSAEAFNVDGLIIRDKRQVPVNGTVEKVAAGALANIKIGKVANLNNLLIKLKKEGYWIYAADGNNGINYKKVNFDGPCALIVGNEGSGISSLVLKNSDYRVKIPMQGHVESLNVSVATGILLSHIRNF